MMSKIVKRFGQSNISRMDEPRRPFAAVADVTFWKQERRIAELEATLAHVMGQRDRLRRQVLGMGRVMTQREGLIGLNLDASDILQSGDLSDVDGIQS